MRQLLLVMTSLVMLTLSALAVAQELLDVPYEVRAELRSSGCEVVRVQQAARTDMGRQTMYVAVCSGVDRYLMAVKCRRTVCKALH